MNLEFRVWHPEKGMLPVYGFNKKFVFIDDLNSPEPGENILPIDDCELMQFTGVTDKNGIEAFKGDIIRYFSCKRYVQQSFAEVRPEIDEFYLVEKIEVIKDLAGYINIESNYDENLSCYFKLSATGFQSVEDIKQLFFENQHLDDEEMISDINGNNIDQDKVGFTIIGNIHENPELI